MNSTSAERIQTGRPIDLGVAVYNILTCPVTAVGNSLLVWTLYRDPLKCFRTLPSYLLAAMAVANVCTGLVTQPLIAAAHILFYLGKGLDTFENAIEPLVGSTSVLALNMSFFNLLALAVDNYVAISRPIKYRSLSTVGKAKVWIAFTLTYSVMFAVIPYVGLPEKLVHQLDVHLNSTLVSLLLLATYILLYKSFRTQAKRSAFLREGQDKEQIRRIQIMEKKFQKMLFLFVLFFTIPALLSTINWHLILYCVDCKRNFPVAFSVGQVVLHNSIFLKPAADSFVFAWRIPKYREALRRSCPCTCTCRKPRRQNAKEMTASVMTLSIRYLDDDLVTSEQQRNYKTSSM